MAEILVEISERVRGRFQKKTNECFHAQIKFKFSVESKSLKLFWEVVMIANKLNASSEPLIEYVTTNTQFDEEKVLKFIFLINFP